MKNLIYYALLITSLLSSWIQPPELYSLETVPVLYQGRFIPLDVYSKLWFSDISGEQYIHDEKFLFQMHFLGSESIGEEPFIAVGSKKIEQLLSSKALLSFNQLQNFFYHNKETNQKLLSPLILSHFNDIYSSTHTKGRNKVWSLGTIDPKLKVKLAEDNGLYIFSLPESRLWKYFKKGDKVGNFSQNTNKLKLHANHIQTLLEKLSRLEKLKGPEIEGEKKYENRYLQLKQQNLPPKEIKRNLEMEFPLEQRLTLAGATLHALPSRYNTNTWIPLKALKLKTYDQETNSLLPVRNFTAYDDETFIKIRKAYSSLEEAVIHKKLTNKIEKLSESLLLGYNSIEGQPYQEVKDKKLFFPSPFKLSIESLFYRIPFTNIIIIGYILSCTTILMWYRWQSATLFYASTALSLGTFMIHTLNLMIRCYLLNRPPVSNMAETVLFVPWVGVATSAIFAYFFRTTIPLLCSYLGAISLFIVLKYSKINLSLENVQAVLDSQFWLTIHVLMVVGSYGVFVISGILGHLYLVMDSLLKSSKKQMLQLGKLILFSMFLGLTLLIPGTILGGVWAAESWGRFWDWDPKESWAFITSCVYLICIHSHYFGIFHDFGLAIGSIVGLMVVGFTWYGVNYILGTGLHSYGFGSGGEEFFYYYLATEVIFLVFICFLRYLWSPQGDKISLK
ncbi:MAG: cytochrome c biogenesis protein CcsA [Chlamydiota bacterium]|nr:cytochrome c biogenesis protein CcsA [Chlamydiota bacterium]